MAGLEQKIKILSTDYQIAVNLCEKLSQKVEELNTVENLKKSDLLKEKQVFEKENQELKNAIQKILFACEKLEKDYKSCPIKNNEDLKKFGDKLIEEFKKKESQYEQSQWSNTNNKGNKFF